jgi:hypothetical protein
MVSRFVDLWDSGKDFQGVQQKFESHGWRSSKVPLRLGVRFVRASGQSNSCHLAIRFPHTSAISCSDGLGN